MLAIIIVFHLRQWQVTHGNTDFAGKLGSTDLWRGKDCETQDSY